MRSVSVPLAAPCTARTPSAAAMASPSSRPPGHHSTGARSTAASPAGSLHAGRIPQTARGHCAGLCMGSGRNASRWDALARQRARDARATLTICNRRRRVPGVTRFCLTVQEFHSTSPIFRRAIRRRTAQDRSSLRRALQVSACAGCRCSLGSVYLILKFLVRYPASPDRHPLDAQHPRRLHHIVSSIGAPTLVGLPGGSMRSDSNSCRPVLPS